MEPSPSVSGFEQYFHLVQELQRQAVESQRLVLDLVASRMVETILRSQRIFIFGTGHSHMLAEETFYRAGGLAATLPVLSPALMVAENPALASRLERMPGLAGLLIERYKPEAGEMLFVISNSGVNRLPVEMGLWGKEHQLVVVWLGSLPYARLAPLSDLGKRLDEVADFTLDTGLPPGDALVPVSGTNWKVGPASTILGALLLNGLVVEASQRLAQMGESAPVFVSLNLPGAAAHNAALLEKWHTVNPLL